MAIRHFRSFGKPSKTLPQDGYVTHSWTLGELFTTSALAQMESTVSNTTDLIEVTPAPIGYCETRNPMLWDEFLLLGTWLIWEDKHVVVLSVKDAFKAIDKIQPMSQYTRHLVREMLEDCVAKRLSSMHVHLIE